MNTDERLDALDKKVEDIKVATVRLVEQMSFVRDSIAPLKSDIVEQCKNEVKAWGWKSLTTLITALVSGLSALVMHFLQR